MPTPSEDASAPASPDAEADERLKRVVRHLAHGQRVAQTGVWVWNPFTDHHSASTAAYRLFGFTADESTTLSLQDFPLRIHADDYPKFESTVAAARRELTDFEVSYRVIHPDGAVRYMHAIGHPVVTETGEVREFIGTVVDTTEQRRAEEARARQLRDAALRADVSAVLAKADALRGMLQGCTDALVRHLEVAFARIWTLPNGGSVLTLEASSGLYTHLDGSHSRVNVGQLKIGLIAEERRAHLTNSVQTDPRVSDKAWAEREGMVAFAGYPLIVEDRIVGVMAMFSRHILLPDTLETIGSIADSIAQGIERKRSQEALRRSEAYLAEGQRLSQTGSWALNVKTGERYWSREVFRIYGLDPAETPPGLDIVNAMTHDDDRALGTDALASAVRDAQEFEIETRIRRGDGSVRYLLTVGHPVLDNSGELTEFIGTIVDITERKRAERRLRKAIRARFDAVLAERLRFARDMHDGLLQDVTGLGLQLRAILPHVRTRPDDALAELRGIMSLAERMSREAREAVTGMRASATVDEVASAVESAAREAARAPLVLSLSVTGRARRVRRDVQDAVARLVREAVMNVVKHASATTVTVVIEFRPRRFRVVVADDGCGFAQNEPAAAGHFGVVGMRERAAAIGAVFAIRSAVGTGTEVSVEIPYRP
jgi:PAS domain S-box-containing protein